MTPTLRRTPVALLVFNRPGATSRVFEAVARARPPTLLVVADGPRADRPEDRELCRDTRAIVERVDWPCEVRKHDSDTNLGCRKRVDTWEYEWAFSSWARDALAVCPAPNLVTNIGFAPGAAHLGDANHLHAELEARPMEFPLRHPTDVRVAENADLLEWQLVNPRMVRRTLLARAHGRLRGHLRAALTSMRRA